MRSRTFLAMLEKTFLMAGERIAGGPEEDEHRASIMVTAFIPNSSNPNIKAAAFKKNCLRTPGSFTKPVIYCLRRPSGGQL